MTEHKHNSQANTSIEHKIDLQALADLSLIDHTTIKTDLESYIKNVFKLIDSLFEIDTSHVKLKHHTVSRKYCREDIETNYHHPITRPIKVDRIVKK